MGFVLWDSYFYFPHGFADVRVSGADAFKQLRAGMPEKNEGENENGDKGRKTVFGEGVTVQSTTEQSRFM